MPAIVIAVAPAQVVLGGPAAATVAVTIELGSAAAASGAPYVYATAGRIVDLRRVDGRHYTAVLEPPIERFPQRSLVAAAIFLQDEKAPPEVAAAVVSYSARLDLKGRIEARANVVLDVGGTRFGPATAGPAGDFVLPIVVPPGENWAASLATDAAGNRSRSRINLYLPKVPRLHAFVYPEALEADGAHAGWVLAASVNAAGQPDTATVRAVARRGHIDSATRTERGVWRFAYGAPAALGDGVDTVVLEGADSAKLEVAVPLVAGAAVHLVTDVTPRPVPADTAVSAKVSVTLSDEAGNAVGGQRPWLVLDGASLPAVESAPGRYLVEVPARTRAGAARGQLRVDPAPVKSCLRPRAVCAAAEVAVVDARGVPCLGELALAAEGSVAPVSVTLGEARGGVGTGLGCAELLVDFRAADGRSFPLTLRPVPALAAARAASLTAEVEVIWRLPAPVVLRWKVKESKAGVARLALSADGVSDLATRVRIEASSGKVSFSPGASGVVDVVLKRDEPKAPVDVVATEQGSGVSAWVRVP